jgi:hypothetical protein
MKFTEYFNFTRQRPDRAGIKLEWIEFTFSKPDHEEMQTDGRVRRWAFIKEADKFLRIVILEDKQTIHNAFFDSSFKLKTK